MAELVVRHLGLVEYLPTLEAIESGAVVGDRPQDPAIVESVEIL